MNDIRRVLSYNDVLLVPRNSECNHLSDADITIPYYSNTYRIIPIINAPMDKICTPELLNLMNKLNMPTTIHRWFKSANEQIKFFESCKLKDANYCFLSVGIVAKWKDWINELYQYLFDNISKISFGILVDVANGDTKSCVDTVEYVRNLFPPITKIMAGNVATRSGFARLQDAGANFIRVGIGGGSTCSTRTTTGFGMPTLTSIMDCEKVKESAYLVADGGIETPGDICKAIAAGADMVMVGKLLAATSLSNGDKLDKDGNLTICEDLWKWVSYSGMASKEAICKLNSKKSVVSIEGESGLIPYTGQSEEVIKNIIGNLQSSVSYYAGCKDWAEFRRKVKFVEITQQGWEESKTRVKI